MNRWLLSLVVPLAALSVGLSEPPAPPAEHAPPMPPPPLLFLRLLGPAGVTATVFPGHARPADLTLPSVVGLRPGYRYRLRLTGLPDQPPGTALYPSIEVHGMLHLPPDLSPAQYPVPVPFTAEDFRRALGGG